MNAVDVAVPVVVAPIVKVVPLATVIWNDWPLIATPPTKVKALAPIIVTVSPSLRSAVDATVTTAFDAIVIADPATDAVDDKTDPVPPSIFASIPL